MSRKTLLTETQVRQFLKLANLSHISNDRLTEMGYDMPGARDEDDELERELDATEDELGAEDELADDEGDELEMDALGGDADGGGGDMVSVDDFMSALENALEDVMGEPTSVEMDDEDDAPEPDLGGEEEISMDAEEEIEEPMMEEAHGDTKKDDDLKDTEDDGARGEKKGDKAYVNEEEIVAEVARRVANRLQAQKTQNDKQTQVDQLAERIFARLTSK